MRTLFSALFFLLFIPAFGQSDTGKWVRAFPITDYIKDISDSIKIVQVQLPDGVAFTEKQVGLLRGLYRDQRADTAVIGSGRCNLIKGNYYYFTINNKKSGKAPKGGDLLFTFMDKKPVYYGNIVKLACYYIGLKDVYEKPFYDRYSIFTKWTQRNEELLIDALVADIHFTGDYFIKNNPELNIPVKSGKNEGKPVLNVMISCNKENVNDFIEYMIARPLLYSGHEWKVSEVFATWLSEGSPTVIKN